MNKTSIFIKFIVILIIFSFNNPILAKSVKKIATIKSWEAYTTKIDKGEGPNYADARFNVIPDPNQTNEKLVVNYNEQDNNYSIHLPKVKASQDDKSLSQENILFDELLT